MTERIQTDIVDVDQIWADTDPRAEGRTLRVDRIDGRYAYCTVLTAAPGATAASVGKTTRIQITRMRPTSHGYRLIVDGDEVR